jgi:hypothetical protein
VVSRRGITTYTFVEDLEDRDMSEQEPVADAITMEELSEVIAEETDETAEEIEEGAAKISIGPPWEGEYVDK